VERIHDLRRERRVAMVTKVGHDGALGRRCRGRRHRRVVVGNDPRHRLPTGQLHLHRHSHQPHPPFVGGVVARAGGGDCRGTDGGIVVCGGMDGWAAGSGLTIGNVIMAGSSTDRALGSDDFMRHEINHSLQWAALGPMMFVSIWGASTATGYAWGHADSGGGGCWNILEMLAGYKGTRYEAKC
jgi:hypothetical protein